MRGVVQGDSEPKEFIPQLVEHMIAGRFPLERLITFYDLADINRAAAESASGKTIKPVLQDAALGCRLTANDPKRKSAFIGRRYKAAAGETSVAAASLSVTSIAWSGTRSSYLKPCES